MLHTTLVLLACVRALLHTANSEAAEKCVPGMCYEVVAYCQHSCGNRGERTCTWQQQLCLVLVDPDVGLETSCWTQTLRHLPRLSQLPTA